MGKTIAIMQPYFLPYVGYWQLMKASDIFVVYDNIKYTKKGWINRNRYLSNGKIKLFSIPLMKASNSLQIKDRYLAEAYKDESAKSLRKIKDAYATSKNFHLCFNSIEKCFNANENNLFKFVYNSVATFKDILGLRAQLVVSSSIACDHSLNSAERVKAICRELGAESYINLVGGAHLYERDDFQKSGIDLHFLSPRIEEYPQLSCHFQPYMSILDICMSCTFDEVIKNII